MASKTNWEDLSQDSQETQRSDDQSSEQEKKIEPIKTTKPEPVVKPSENEQPNMKSNNNNNDRPKKNFPKPEQLIQILENSTRKQHILTINYCFHYNQQQLKEMFSMIKHIKNYREGSYEVTFESKEDCIKFIQEKNAEKVKFFIKIPQPRYERPYREQNMRNNNQNYSKKIYVPPAEKPQIKKSAQTKVQQPKAKTQKKEYFFQNKAKITQQDKGLDIVKEIEQKQLQKNFKRIRLINQDINTNKFKQICDQIQLKVKWGYKLANQQSEAIFTEQEQKVATIQNSQNQINKVEIKQVKPETPKDYTYKKNTKKKYQPKEYLRHNIIYMEPNIPSDQVINQIKQKNLFTLYGAIRIKTQEAYKSQAKQLAFILEKQFKCQIIKQKISEEAIVFILQQIKDQEVPQKVKRKYKQKQVQVFFKQNKIVLQDNTSIQSVVQQIKKNKKILQKDFFNIKIVCTPKQLTMSRKIAEILANQLNLTQQKEILKKDSETDDTYIIQVSLQQKARIGNPNTDSYLDIEKKSVFNYDEEINVQRFLEEFKNKRKAIYQIYHKFRIIAKDDFIDKATKLGNMLKDQNKLAIKQEKSKLGQSYQLEIYLSQKNSQAQDQPQSKRGKLDPSPIHQHLSKINR